MPHINEMFAFIAGPEDDEGVIGYRSTDGWMPLVAADAKRVDLTSRPLAPPARGPRDHRSRPEDPEADEPDSPPALGRDRLL